jgi:dihydrofolate reductase
MRKIILQNMVTLDGYFEGPNREIDWHNVDTEFNEFAIDFMHGVDTFIFGRVTYQLMADYWPTVTAARDDPFVAEIMNNYPKIVYSRTLNEAPWGKWNNARLVKELKPDEVRAWKEQPGKNIAIFGSSNLSLSFLHHGLIDEIHVLVNPQFLGGGHPLLEGLNHRLPMRLLDVHRFNSGNVELIYEPVR